MNREPFDRPPKWWAPKLTPWWVRATRGVRRYRLLRRQSLSEIRCTGWQHVADARAQNKGILITPNHSAHYDSEALYAVADRYAQPLYFMTAWQVFAAGGRFEKWAMQRMGCFSIDRESADRRAFSQAVSIMRSEPHPLVIFPEGDIYHVSDRVTKFHDGAATVAVAAARRSQRQVVAIPCAIKFWYMDDPSPSLLEVTSKLERRVRIASRRDYPLARRIYRIASAALAKKEVKYLGGEQRGSLPFRMELLAETVLARLESSYRVNTTGEPIPWRVKAVRQRIIERGQQSGKASSNLHRQEIAYRDDMEALFFAVQIYSYPQNYLVKDASIERIAETVDKLEEDVLESPLPTVHGRRRVVVKFGPAIEVDSGHLNRSQVNRSLAQGLTDRLEGQVQRLLDELNSAAAPHESTA